MGELSAFASALVKIANDESHERKKPGYLRAVATGLPFVAAQAVSDIPESMIERGVQNKILQRGGLPPAGKLLNTGLLRFGSRIGAGAFTTPIFLSGMHDITNQKNKYDERKGVAKLMAAGGLYAGLRGGIEAKFDTELAHIPMQTRLKKVVGFKTLRGIGAAAATGVMLGRNLREQRSTDNPTFMQKYVKPALIGSAMAAGSSVVEGALTEGFKTPEARLRIGAKVGGKMVAGAAATLFLSQLMKRFMPHEKKAAQKNTNENMLRARAQIASRGGV